MKYDRGDVVFGADPFNDRDAPRPWLILSDDDHPFYGEQYVAVTLTTKTYHDGVWPLDSDDWSHGRMPEKSSVVPWGIASPNHDDLNHDRYQGTLKSAVVEEIAEAVFEYISP